jgi:RNA-binding protein 5/10
VDPLFPFVQMPPPASHSATQTAAFYKVLQTGVPHNGRRVKIDYSQSALPDKARGRQNMNDGTCDIGNTQGPVLLFRGLDPLLGPQAIAQAMMNSAGLGQSGAKGMKQIIIIKDRVTLASFGLAFVEFIDAQVMRGGVVV